MRERSSDEPDDGGIAVDEASPRRGRRFREKLPELLIEALSVAFAVLLALAVDEWREERSNLELADRALASILNEVETNLGRLEENAADRDSLLAYLTDTRNALEQEEELETISVDFTPAFVASTAWETARVTRAVHFMEYDKVARIGRVYEFQDLYVESEETFVDLLAGIMEANWEEPVEAITIYQRGLARLDRFADDLETVYREVLESGFGPSADPDSASVDLPAS